MQNTLFKVHKSFLGKHSEVFRDLFLVPQPEYPGTSSRLDENDGSGADGSGSVGIVSPIGCAGEGGLVEFLDGLPVVYLSDDEGDVAHLLNALYDRSYVPSSVLNFLSGITNYFSQVLL